MPHTAAKPSSPAEELFAEIRAFCVRKADPQIALKYSRYFTEGYDAYGLSDADPDWKAHRRAWAERVHRAGPKTLWDAADLLMETGKYEEASFAIVLASDLPQFHTRRALKRIEGWFEGGIRNWAHTDVLCREVLSRFLSGGVIGVDAIARWAKSPHKYQRRALPVALIYVLDATDDPGPLLAAIEPLMHDSERVVQQGVGWFLRECWKRRPAATEALLTKYRDDAPRLIYQYATEKMTAAQKARFRKRK